MSAGQSPGSQTSRFNRKAAAPHNAHEIIATSIARGTNPLKRPPLRINISTDGLTNRYDQIKNDGHAIRSNP